jgi:hypothetical protein
MRIAEQEFLFLSVPRSFTQFFVEGDKTWWQASI